MKETKFRDITGYDYFIKDCNFFLLSEEYPGWTGKEKYGIVTSLSEEELKQRYPELMAALCPYLLLDKNFGAARREYRNNEKKHLWRSITSEIAFDFDEDTECCHRCLQQDHMATDVESDVFIQDVLSRLSKIQRRRIVSYFFEGLTYKEIAAQEGTTDMAIIYSVRCGLKNLEKFLHRDFVFARSHWIQVRG